MQALVNKLKHLEQIQIDDNVKTSNGYIGSDFQVHYTYTHNNQTYDNIKELIAAKLAYKYIQLDKFRRLVTED